MNDALITFIYVDDLRRSDDFYRRDLGLTPVTDQTVCRIYRISGSGFLGVCTTDRPVTPEGLIITLVRQDVEAFCERLVANGVVLEQSPTHNPRFGITHAFLRDPDGHLIEIQRFDDPDWSTTLD
jgi:catechol 2,3-dioxygenase-like lactoylglutathione lyase family enzyme